MSAEKNPEKPKVFQPDAAPPLFSGGPTVASVLDWYQNNQLQEYSPVAFKERQRVWELFRKMYGKELVENCRGADLIQFITNQRGCKSNATRRRLKATISRPFNLAVEVGLIPKNPFGKIHIPEGKNGRDWTKEEFQAALRHSSPFFRRLLIFMRFSGARPGEARILEWEHIRDDIEVIILPHHKTFHLGHARRIFFNGVLVKLLAWISRNKTHDKFVLTNKLRQPWTMRALCNHMALVRERAGLKREVKAHGVRHTFATNAIMAGVDVSTLAELLGHKSLHTTERYVHLLNKRAHLNRAMNKAVGRKPEPETKPQEKNGGEAPDHS